MHTYMHTYFPDLNCFLFPSFSLFLHYYIAQDSSKSSSSHLCPESSCYGKLKLRPDNRVMFCPECGYNGIHFSCDECVEAGRKWEMKGVNGSNGRLQKLFCTVCGATAWEK